MNIEIRLSITTEAGVVCDETLLSLDKSHDQLEAIGLTLQEAKKLLKQLQGKIVDAQAQAYSAERRSCHQCGQHQASKGYSPIRFRTAFGDVMVPSLRLYRCRCQAHAKVSKTFSPLNDLFKEHVSPELLYLETRWASLVSFGVTVDLLKDVLPVGTTLNAETIRHHLHGVAQRLSSALKPDTPHGHLISQQSLTELPEPEGPIVVGIDGGYVKNRNTPTRHFEVLVGKSIAEDRDSRYFGLVQSVDQSPRNRLQSILDEQEFQGNQNITFMTDGGDTVRKMAANLSPCAEHILDWFHVTMRITVMKQYIKGVIHHEAEEGQRLKRELKRIKGYLWHGNLHRALPCIEDWADDLEGLECDYASLKALRKAANEFCTYIKNNAASIPNYAERHRYGERVSTAFVESTVNVVVGKRFCKKQQMRWSKQGAHYLLQTRTRTLDGTLRQMFETWYPGMKVTDDELPEKKMAA